MVVISTLDEFHDVVDLLPLPRLLCHFGCRKSLIGGGSPVVGFDVACDHLAVAVRSDFGDQVAHENRLAKNSDLNPANLSGMSNALIPEVRVDKNGVPVTRHVRPQVNNGGSNLPTLRISTPVPNRPYPDRNSDLDYIFDECDDFLMEGGVSQDLFHSTLNSYSDHTIRVIKTYLGDDEGHLTYYSELTALIGTETPELDVREYMMYSFHMSDCPDLLEVRRYIRGLRNYKPLKGIEDFTRVDPETEALSRSLLRIGFQLHCMQDDDHPSAVYVPDPRDKTEKTPIFKLPSLLNLITENVSRSSDIADHIEEYGFKSTKVLAQMIEGSHHATRDGFL